MPSYNHYETFHKKGSKNLIGTLEWIAQETQ